MLDVTTVLTKTLVNTIYMPLCSIKFNAYQYDITIEEFGNGTFFYEPQIIEVISESRSRNPAAMV